MKSRQLILILVYLFFTNLCFTGLPGYAQTGDSIVDNEILTGKSSQNNYLVFGYSYPSANNKLVLNNGGIILSCMKSGWFKDDGSHSTTNPNYLSGFSSSYFHNFFAFDLAGVTDPITTAVLQIQKYTSVPTTGYIAWELFEVTSPYASVNMDYSAALGNLPAGLSIYNDFGSGVSYALDTIDGSLSANTIISVVLNDSALIRLNSALGGNFIIGGTSDSYLPHLPPIVTTIEATDIQSTGVTLNGIVNPNGTPTSVSFYYGTDPANLAYQLQVPGSYSGQGEIPVNVSVSGLSDNTQYYFKVTAENTDLISVSGQILTFTTPPILIKPPAPLASSPQNFCTGATIANLQSEPPQGCLVHWYTASIGGNSLPDSIQLLTDHTYYGESYQIGTGLTSLTRTQVIVVLSHPAQPIISGPGTVCRGHEISNYFTASSMINYEWSVSPGGTIVSGGGTNDNFISIAWEVTGIQRLEVIFSDQRGCKVSSPGVKMVEVSPSPVPTISGLFSVCEGSPGTLYNTEPGMISYSWTVSPGGTIIAGGTSLSDSMVVTWNIPGQHSIGVNYSTTNGCRATEPSIYNVVVNPGIFPVITGTEKLCLNSEHYAYSTDPGMTNYNWMVTNGGTILSGMDSNVIEVSWNTPGSQSVSVSFSTPAGCMPLGDGYLGIQVDALPNSAQEVSGNQELCSGSTGIHYTVEPVLNAEAYVWNLPSGAIVVDGAGTNAIVVDFLPGAESGEITVFGENSCGSGESSPGLDIIILPMPGDPQEITGPSEVCKNRSSENYSLPPIPDALEYIWDIPPGASILSGSGTSSISVAFPSGSSSGEITVFGKNLCGAGKKSENFHVNVHEVPPAPIITISGNLLQSNAADFNQWYLNGTEIPGATGQEYEITQNGTYWSVVITDNCSSDTSNNVTVVLTKIWEKEETAFQIYPVPNNGHFAVKMNPAEILNSTLRIYNDLGSVVYENRTIQCGGNLVLYIDLPAAAPGNYAVVFQNEGHRIVRKFIITSNP